MRRKHIILFAILILGAFFRFYRLGTDPAGFHQDEVSQAYNAFSILETGKDRYGEDYPILFRSFGSYQPSVYTYITPIFIYFFGNTIFAARFTSALFGTLIIVVTYLIVKIISKKQYSEKLALMSSFVVAFSPWAIHFSRRVVEGNLGLFFFLLAFYLLLKSIKKIVFLPFAAAIMGIATHAYYSERVIGLVFFFAFIIYLRKHFLKNKKWLVYGLGVFGVIMIPHLFTIVNGAFFARYNQVRSSDSGQLIMDFIKHFVSYLSPKNLFGDIGGDLGRVSPGLGVFYDWLLIPLLFGIYNFKKFLEKGYLKLLGILFLLSLVPVAMTGDVFYPLRALEYFWLLSLVISIGILVLINFVKSKYVKIFIFSALALYSLGIFYVSYFVFFNHESTENIGKTYISLVKELDKYKSYSIVVDDPRDPAIGLRIAYIKKFDPVRLQESLRPQMKTPYYSSVVNQDETYIIDNLVVRKVDWTNDPCDKNTILVGDNLTFSEKQIDEHNLSLIFELTSVNRDFTIRGFATNPDKNCSLQPHM